MGSDLTNGCLLNNAHQSDYYNYVLPFSMAIIVLFALPKTIELTSVGLTKKWRTSPAIFFTVGEKDQRRGKGVGINQLHNHYAKNRQTNRRDPSRLTD